jgi:hypothetical protein
MSPVGDCSQARRALRSAVLFWRPMEEHCQHKHKRSSVTLLEPSSERWFLAAAITIQCETCGHQFEFAGILEGPGVVLSADRRELQVAITETIKDNGAKERVLRPSVGRNGKCAGNEDRGDARGPRTALL